MDLLLDPNVAYLMLAGGLVFAILAMLSPGTGILEIVALFVLLLSGVSVYMLADQNRINWWSLIIIVTGLVLFILAVRRPQQPIYLIVSIAALALGSIYLFRGEAWYIPGVNPYLAATVSILSSVFFWVVTRKVLEAGNVRPTHDLESLVGATGEARSEIHRDGSVQVFGELWSAHSDQPIPEGTQIRVTGRDGFTLKVEAIE